MGPIHNRKAPTVNTLHILMLKNKSLFEKPMYLIMLCGTIYVTYQILEKWDVIKTALTGLFK